MSDEKKDKKRIYFDAHDSKVIKWLQEGASTDDARPVLCGINVGENVVSADGFQLRVAPNEIEELQVVEGTYELDKIRAGTNIVEAEEVPGSYPEYRQIIPADKPLLRIAVNAKFLTSITKGMKGSVVLEVPHNSGGPLNISGRIEANGTITEVFAMIMPMHLDEHDMDVRWRPVEIVEQEEVESDGDND